MFHTFRYSIESTLKLEYPKCLQPIVFISLKFVQHDCLGSYQVCETATDSGLLIDEFIATQSSAWRSFYCHFSMVELSSHVVYPQNLGKMLHDILVVLSGYFCLCLGNIYKNRSQIIYVNRIFRKDSG